MIADQFPISSLLLAMAPNTEQFSTEGARMLVQERLVREVLSGPNTGAAFAVATNGIASGLIESGVTHDNYGAAVTDFGRDDILTVEQNLRDANPAAGAWCGSSRLRPGEGSPGPPASAGSTRCASWRSAWRT